MIDQKMIPPEVIKAFHDGWAEEGPDWFARTFARCLNAWPGIYSTEPSGGEIPNARPFIILPLPQEARDA